MSKVLCFGELLLRIAPPSGIDWLEEGQLPVFAGGSELNVASALAQWGQAVKYCTALPNNGISKDIIRHIGKRGIDLSTVIYTGERIGLYFLQQGADMKGVETVYDRKHSSFATLGLGEVDWTKVLEDVHWFHFSAIVPALSGAAAALCKEALEAAHAMQIPISVDLNYRSLLWKYGKTPEAVMPELLQYCTLVMGNIWSANALLNIPLHQDIQQFALKDQFIQQATETANEIRRRFPSCIWVANTFRFDRVSVSIEYYAALDHAAGRVQSPLFTSKHITEKVGSGDCFMAGLIYGILSGHTPQEIVNFAAAAAFGKLHEKGDSTGHSLDQVQKILQPYL